MRRISTKIIIGTLFLLSFYTITVFAETEDQNRMLNMNNMEKEISQEGSSYSIDVQYGDTRGSIISTAIASISDEGKGTIFMSIQTLAHESCDKIKQNAYLERWDDKNSSWIQVKSYEFVEVIEDQPDGRLPYLINEMTLSGQKIGGEYRLRTTHIVTLNGTNETLRTATDTIILKK